MVANFFYFFLSVSLSCSGVSRFICRFWMFNQKKSRFVQINLLTGMLSHFFAKKINSWQWHLQRGPRL
ncbi:hypothetical protein C7T94_05300 [Pedobacter yulinensis]|uniref:Uncharacterized protein n=1 Tax=Pedobacter yulinensis TaxID=2126353 RepID=A0A2T3HNZ2_9SPHI|nr:hypothetical protein C7T94_05300 [Pedobacter yulinensis]